MELLMFGFEIWMEELNVWHGTKDILHQYSLYVPINQNATTQVECRDLKQFVSLNVAVHVAVLYVNTYIIGKVDLHWIWRGWQSLWIHLQDAALNHKA